MQVFSTTKAAEICGLSRRFIAQCVDSGRLKGYKVPGSKIRRIPRDCLVKFMTEYKIPLGILENDEMIKILAVSTDPWITVGFKQDVERSPSLKAKIVPSIFEAGVVIKAFRPDCVVVDFAIHFYGILAMCHNIRHNPEFEDMIIIGLLSDAKVDFDGSALTEMHKKPVNLAFLAERIQNLVESRKKHI